MPVSEGNIGFNDITQELYGRVPQAGDNLLQMFDDGLEAGFNPIYDVGAAGPGDAMSEFNGYTHVGIFGGTWENYKGYRTPYIPDSVYQKYFSSGDLAINVALQIKRRRTGDDTGIFDAPITATLTIGGVTLSTIDQSESLGDDILFKIKASDGIPSGIYNWNTDVVVTVKDASGYVVNAETYSSTFTGQEFPQYLHILDKDTAAYRWMWAQTSTAYYPIVYPTAEWTVTTPVRGSVPGSSSPRINIKITDMAGFGDITAYVALRNKGEGVFIGSDVGGWVGIGASFILNTNKAITFDVTEIQQYMVEGESGPNGLIDVLLLPFVRLKFGEDAFNYTVPLSQSSTEIPFFKILTETYEPTTFTWEWDTPITKDDLIDPVPEDDDPEELDEDGGVTKGGSSGGGGGSSEDDDGSLEERDDLDIQ